MTEERENKSLIEQHISVILQIMVVGLLAWSLKTTQELSSDVSVLKVQVQALQVLVQQAANDRYRAADAEKDVSRIYSDMKTLETRITRLEGHK